MEDQQPAAGDLTEEAPEAPETSMDTEATEAGVEPATEPEESSAAEPSAVAARAGVGKRFAALILVGAALFVGASAFAGATLKPYLAERATVETKLRVARTAANAITALWSYTPESMDTLADRAATYLTGDFGAQYRKYVDAIVAPNKQAKITSTTEVTGVAVEEFNLPYAVALVYTNTTSMSPLTKNIPALRYLSYRVFMKRVDGRWLVTRMTTVTSLDLTPHP